jgi:RsiW-degrading membrane proteinase PrsW (M82 family)
MKYFAVSLAAFIPGIAWLYYFYRCDRYEPEPVKLVIRTFIVGMLVALAMGTAYSGLDYPWGPYMWAAVIFAPLVEEPAKFLVVRWTVFNNRQFNEPFDGIIYAVSAALGFAAVENIMYVAGGWFDVNPVAGLYTLLSRTVLSVPGHALFSAWWGAALGWSKGKKPLSQVLMVGGGLLASMVFHAAFNWFAGNEVLGGLAFLVFLAVLWRVTWVRLIKPALKASPFRTAPEKVDEPSP